MADAPSTWEDKDRVQGEASVYAEQKPFHTTSLHTSTSSEMPSTTAMNDPIRLLVIGAGQRGIAYADPISRFRDVCVHAVAEPATFRRKIFGQRYVWGDKVPSEGQEFTDWKSWLIWETDRRRRESNGEAVPPGVDGVLVCTLDDMHLPVLQAIAPLNLHVLSEKPLATSWDDCRAIGELFASHNSNQKVFSIGHVLRYSPHNMALQKLLLEDKVIGEPVSIEHTEPVGWQHYAHSYTRGNWRRQSPNADGSLLTKCCHDLDFLLWIMAQPYHRTAGDRGTHMPRTVTSTGALNLFRKSRKPAAAGPATNCTSCPHERDCQYSAVRIYDDNRLAVGKTHWLNHVVHDLEDTFHSLGEAPARAKLHSALAEDYPQLATTDAAIAARPWYGRCVYESDNNVCDDQWVTLAWDEQTTSLGEVLGAKTATLHMIANTERECERRGIVYGTKGELSYESTTIKWFDFVTQTEHEVRPEAPPIAESGRKSHGGGDAGLAKAFVDAVLAVEREGWHAAKAQAKFVGCTLEDAIMAHAMVFCAEEARRDEKVIKWGQWWNENGTKV